MKRRPQLLTVAGFDRIPFLVHGFGTAAWTEEDFRKDRRWQDFRILDLEQVHSDVVHFVDRIPRRGLRGDALITTLTGLLLVIKSADCLPVLLVDEKKRAVAAVHCGWRGTLRGVLRKAIRRMKAWAGSSPLDILAALGPAIDGNCYEVGEDVRERFLARRFSESLFRLVPGHPGKHYFDLRQANRLQLDEEGIPDGNVFSLPICPHCDRRFPSFRRDRERTGRMLSFIGLREASALPSRSPER